MKARKLKDRTGATETGSAFYVYLIGERGAVEPLLGGPLPEAIEEGAPLEVIDNGDLAAVSSAVPLSDYGEEALEARIANPAWTAVRAMRHERVVEHFAERASAVPLRFGTIYLSRERVRRMLDEERDSLRAVIERLRGREEWGVNLYRDRAKSLESVVTRSPRLRELTERAMRSSPGQAYLLKKKIDAMRADEAREETRRAVSEIERELASVSEAGERLRVLKDETGEQGEVAAKLAFLVARARFDEFRRAAEGLAERNVESGLRIELTGPWPAYNFATAPNKSEGDVDETE
jgi:hypothetical protein